MMRKYWPFQSNENDIYRKLGLEVGFLGHEFVLLLVEFGNGAGFGLQTVEQIFLLFVQLGQVGLELLAEFLLFLEVGLGSGGLVFKGLDLILDTGDVEQRLDLLPQTVPGPGAHLQVAAQVALDNAQGNTAIVIQTNCLCFFISRKTGPQINWKCSKLLTVGLAIACTVCGCGNHG